MEEVPLNQPDGAKPSLRSFIKKGWKFITGSVFSSAINSTALIAIPFFLAHIIDAFKDRAGPIPTMSEFLNSPEFYWTLAIGGGSITFQCLSSLRSYFIKRAAIEVQTHTLPKVLEKSVELTYMENQKLEKGEIEQVSNELQSNLESLFTSIIQAGSSSIELLLAMIVVALKFEYEFSGYLAGISVFNVGTLLAIKRVTQTLDEAKINADKKLSSVVHDVVANYENIKVSGKETYVVESFAKPSISFWSSQQKRSNLRAEGFSMFKDAFLACFATYVIARAVYLLSTTPDRSIDDVTYIVIYLRMIIYSSSMFDSQVKRGMTAYRTLTRIVDILNKEVEVNPAQDVLPVAEYPAIDKIMFNHVRYKLGEIDSDNESTEADAENIDESRPLLSEANNNRKHPDILGPLNFELNRGTFTGVAGGSGSGKTVITRLLFRFLNLSVGEGGITLGLSNGSEMNVQELPLRVFRQQVCYTPQSIGLFDGDLMKNITLDEAENVDQNIYAQALEMARLNEKEKKSTAEEIKKFSGGQRQRIALARAFYQYLQGCRIFIFDESTSALDATLQSEIMREIYTLRDNGCLVFFVAHRLSTIRNADQIFFLSKERAGSEVRSIMELQRAEEGVSAFDAMRKKSEKFNALVVAEFGEDLAVRVRSENLGVGRNSRGMFNNSNNDDKSDFCVPLVVSSNRSMTINN